MAVAAAAVAAAAAGLAFAAPARFATLAKAVLSWGSSAGLASHGFFCVAVTLVVSLRLLVLGRLLHMAYTLTGPRKL